MELTPKAEVRETRLAARSDVGEDEGGGDGFVVGDVVERICAGICHDIVLEY
jgi:hypothetical protein